MKTLSTKHLLLLAFAVAVLAGCGGKVEVDMDAYAGSASGSGPGDGAGPVADPCASFCAKSTPLCGEGAFPCEDACEATLANLGQCRDLRAKAYACYAEHVDTEGCSPSECDADLTAANQCVTPAGACDADTYCGVEKGDCTTTCGGVEYSVECPMKKPDGSGTGTACTCRVGGQVVGTCAATLLDPFIWTGCCAQYFAEAK
jgi:hypothetical protein